MRQSYIHKQYWSSFNPQKEWIAGKGKEEVKQEDEQEEKRKRRQSWQAELIER